MGLRATAVRLRIDARRPASWVALGGTAAAGCWLAGEPPERWPLRALLAGAVASAAAIGALPRLRPGDGPAWAGLRAAWPAVGAVLAWLVVGGDLVTLGPTVAMLAACAAMVVAVGVADRAGLAPADALAVALALAAAAGVGATVASTVAPSSAPRAACAGAITGWCVAAGVALAARRARLFEGIGGRDHRGGVVPGAAMTSALAGMVFFLFLSPHLDAAYLALAAAWIVLVALPRATLGPGPDGDAARRLVAATTPRPLRPAREAARILAAHAAVFAWPPLVAAVVADSAGAARPLAIAASIGIGALALAATSALAARAGASRETTWALTLATALAGFVLGDATYPWSGLEPAVPPGLMLSNPGDPARLPEPRAKPRFRPHPRGVASCPDSPSPARPCRPGVGRRSSCS